jgi:hypothetical protein
LQKIKIYENFQASNSPPCLHSQYLFFNARELMGAISTTTGVSQQARTKKVSHSFWNMHDNGSGEWSPKKRQQQQQRRSQCVLQSPKPFELSHDRIIKILLGLSLTTFFLLPAFLMADDDGRERESKKVTGE